MLKYLGLQILQALISMKQSQIIHCDLKPENIMIKNLKNFTLKIIDFGSSCFENNNTNSFYIQSRYYRAPEILLGLQYSYPIDMWSFGCIIFELYTGFPLFNSMNQKDHMQCIMDVLGVPPNQLIKVLMKRKERNQVNILTKMGCRF